MQAAQIIAALQTGGKPFSKDKIKQQAAIGEIIMALQSSSDQRVRQVLCDILGELHASEAIASLVAALGDDSEKVRSAAADALAKIGNVTAGSALLERYHMENSVEVRRMLAAALGAIQYQPAIPALIQILSDEDASLRGTAAWSLGHLVATEAEAALRVALQHETLPYAVERMREAIALLQDVLKE